MLYIHFFYRAFELKNSIVTHRDVVSLSLSMGMAAEDIDQAAKELISVEE